MRLDRAPSRMLLHLLRTTSVLFAIAAVIAHAEKTTGAGTTKDGASTIPRVSEPASSSSNCDRIRALYQKAEELERNREFENAATVAGQIELDLKCRNSYVQAKRLQASSLVFGLGRFEEGIRAADDGLRVDERAADLWFARGYALFRSDRPEEAISSLRSSLANSAAEVVDGCNQTWVLTHFLIASATDRMVPRPLPTKPLSSELAARVAAAVAAWRETEPICARCPCPEPFASQAKEKLAELIPDQP